MDIELLPTRDELLSEEASPFFPNIIRGEYPDVSAYLDIHYSLLREDFIRPVREAISNYKKSPGKNVDNLHIFPSAQFGQVCKISHELGIEVQFSDDTCDDEDWENSKSLLRGSLLLFTQDNFQSYILGTVLFRDVVKLKRGVVTVQLHGYSPFFVECSRTHYVMAECETYFLPYCNVMRVLRTLDERTFPFRSEFIFAHKDSFLPEYLDDLSKYHLPNGKTTFVSELRSIPPEELGLNDSQFSAVATALSKRIALIQGPPGTGKTYVGSKIAEILITNSHIWNPHNNSPLLLVCASNQALDQLAESLLKFTDEIIRVGEQSKSEALARFNMNVIQKRETRSGRSEQTKEMKRRYREMMVLWDNLTRTAEVLKDTREEGGDINPLIDSLIELENNYSKAVRLFKKEQQKNVQTVLMNAKVLAMTTTRAAHMNEVLQRVRPPIVIVEEAAEMFEAHVVASLTSYCKHLILIGDHQQLRPIAAHPQFAKQSHLDVSLFERLINNHVVHERLTVQHRMREEIAELLALVFYRDLNNHPSTVQRLNISGMKKNLFFMSHQNGEEKHAVLSGYCNRFEALFIVKFAQYLVSKGHRAEDLTILAPYTLQVRLIRKFQMKINALSGCFVTTIDGFQGQENKIVLISWVRNRNGIGFLSSENRVCVALSRARDGLYMMGDMPLLMERSALWRKVGDYLKSKDLIGEGFPLENTSSLARTVEELPRM